MIHSKAGERPIGLGIIAGIIYVIVRADQLDAIELITLLLMGLGLTALWLAVMINQLAISGFHRTLFWPAALIMGIVLLGLGIVPNLLARGALLAIVLTGFLYLLNPNIGFAGPLVAILAIVLTPPIFWPHQQPVSYLALVLLLASAFGLMAATFSTTRRASASYRLFAYTVWMLWPIYIALQMWPGDVAPGRSAEWTRWLVLLGGVGIVTAMEIVVERWYRDRIRWPDQLGWLVQREAFAALVDRKIKLTDDQLEEAKRSFGSMSGVQPRAMLDSFFVDALSCQQSLDRVLRQVALTRIQAHPSTTHLVRRRIYDLPADFDKNMRLYSESRLWSLPTDLSSPAEDSFAVLMQKNWEPFVKKRREVIDTLSKSGELAKQLRATPKPDNAFSNGLLLDYAPDSTGVVEAWERLLRDELSPFKVLGEEHHTAMEINTLLTWLNEVKGERDKLIQVATEWQVKAREHLKEMPKLTVSAVLLFLESIIEQGWSFEALLLIDVARNVWCDRPAVEALQRVQAQAEFNLLTLDQSLPMAKVVVNTLEQALDYTHVYVANATRNIATLQGVKIHVVIKGETSNCFDLPVDQGRWLPIRVGHHDFVVSTYDSRFPPVHFNWKASTNSVQELKVVLTAR